MDILLILLLIALNGVFAMSEISIVSSRRVRLQQMADNGDKGAKAALALADHPTFFLSTVQIGITLIGVMSGAIGEGAITDRLRPFFESIPALAPYAKPLATTCMVIIITYFSLIIGELVPKRLGMQSPERIARVVAPLIRGVLFLTHPAVRFLSWSAEHVLRLLGAQRMDEAPVTEEEIKVLMAEGAEAGIFEQAERELVANVFRMDEWNLSLIMTTRPDIAWLDLDDELDGQRAVLAETPYSYLPVCRGGADNIAGVLSLPQLLQH
ncbi:MAG: hemolysin family protein [Perlucidibaca sp.]